MRFRWLANLVLASLLLGIAPARAAWVCPDGTPCQEEMAAGCCAFHQPKPQECGRCESSAPGARFEAANGACASNSCEIRGQGDSGTRLALADRLSLLPDLALLPAEPILFEEPEATEWAGVEHAYPVRAPPDRLTSPTRGPPAGV